MNIKQWLKWIFFILTAIAVILWVGGMLLNTYLEKKLLVQEFRGYQVDSVKLKVNLFKMGVSFKNLHVSTKDSVATRLVIQEGRFSGINPFKLLENKIQVSHANIDGVDFIYQPPAQGSRKSDTSVSGKEMTWYIGNLSLQIKRILWFKPGGYTHSGRNDTLLYSEAFLKGSELKWNKKQKTPGFPFSYKALYAKIPLARVAVSDSLYGLNIYNLELDTDNESIKIPLVKLVTRYERYEVGKLTGEQRDWLDLSFSGISIRQIEFNQMITDTSLIAEAMHIAYFKARAFKDRRLTFPDKPDTRLPDALLRSLPVGIAIDSVLIEKGDVEYAERTPGSTAEALVKFNQLQATWLNVGNRSQKIKAPTSLEASAMFMNEAYLKASFDLPNVAFDKSYKATGTLHAMPLTSINNILQQSAGAKVVKGELKRMDFNFVYNNNVSDGDLALQYKDLNIKLINKEDKSEKKLLTAVVNLLVVPADNLAGDKSFKKGEIHTERDKKRSIFNFWWKSLLSGIKSTFM